jgi:hypothetical protein
MLVLTYVHGLESPSKSECVDGNETQLEKLDSEQAFYLKDRVVVDISHIL